MIQQQRWQNTISRSRALSSSSTTICGGNIVTAVRPLSLYSTSTLQQNYYDALSLQQTSSIQWIGGKQTISSMLVKGNIHLHQGVSSNSISNQLRWFGSSGYGTHHRDSNQGRDGHSTNRNYRIPNMKEFNTLDDAIEVYYNNLEIVTPRNLSSFWSAVPRLLKYQNNGVNNLVPQLEAIFLKTADQIHSYGPQDLATTTLGFAKTIQALQRNKRGYSSGSYEGYLHGILIRQRDAVFSFLARTAVNKLNQFEPRYLKDLAYTYAILDFMPKQLDDGSTLFNHIAEKSIPLLNKFKPQELANTVWAFEKVKVSHPTLYEKVGDYIVTRQQLNDFDSQALSNILIAYAKAGVIHPKLFEKLGDHIVSLDHLHDFSPQALANVVWAFEKAAVSHPDLFTRIGEHIVASHLNKFQPQNLSNILIAYAKAGISHPDVFNKVADHIVLLDNLDDYNAQSLANIVWAFDRANVHHHELYGRVGDHIVALDDHLNKFQPQNLSNILIAYAKAEVSHPGLFDKVADHIVTLTRQQLNDFKPQELSNILNAYAKAGVIRQDLFTRIGDHIVITLNHVSDFKPQELSNIIYAYAKAKVSHPDLFNKVGDHIVMLDQLNDFKPQNLSNIVWSYAKAEVSHLDLFNKVADHIVSLDNLDGYNEQNISNLAWAYHKAGIIHQDLNNKLKGAADSRKEEFNSRNLNNLYHWTSEEVGVQNQEDDEQNGDQNDSLAVVDDDNDTDIEIEEEEEEDDASTTIPVPEDLSLLTVVQLKDRLRDLGLRVSGRKQELIDRLNDHIQSSNRV